MVKRDHTRTLLLLVLLLILAGVFFTGEPKNPPTPSQFQAQARAERLPQKGSALILYDENKPYDGGAIHAAAIANLLGHFNFGHTIKPVAEYTPGEMDAYNAVIYIGFVKNAFIPGAFFKDIFSSPDKTIVWFQHNLNQLQGSASFDFMKEYGFAYTRSVQFGETRSKNPAAFFDRFYYKGRVLDRGRITGRLKDIADINMVIAKVADPSIAKTWAAVENPDTNEKAPYIIQAKNIWYVADTPFTYLDLRDSYLIICDILHDILKIDHPRKLRALFRIEDVNPSTSADEMKRLLAFFQYEKIPVTIGLIPFFRDPAGIRYDRPVEMTLSDSPELLGILKKAQDGGASFVMHGVTHQRDDPKNPLLRVTAFGYEFWDGENMSAVEGDSAEEVKKRIARGVNEFQRYGIRIAAYETPHYIASPLDYRVFAEEFDFTMQNVTYYMFDVSRLAADKGSPKKPVTEMVNQTFPYTIYGDIYGQYIIPSSTIDSMEFADVKSAKSVEEKMDLMLKEAEALTIVRDGCASFYVHPFVITGMQQHNIRWRYVLKAVTGALRGMGYEFTAIKELEKTR